MDSQKKNFKKILQTRVQNSSISKHHSKNKKLIYQSNQKTKPKTLNKVKKNDKVKRKQYSKRGSEQAVLAVKDGASYGKAAESLGVPSATLFRKMKCPTIKVRPGPNTVLTEDEEDEFVNWIIYRAETGSPVTKDELFRSVQSYLNSLKRKSSFKNNLPGKKLYHSFRQRHPNISLRTPQNLPLCRVLVTEEVLRSWFEEVETYLVKKNLKYIEGSRVFNCDETNFAFCPKPEKVLVKKGAKSVYKVNASAEKENITTIFMYNAEGLRVNPMTLFKYQETIPKNIANNAPIDWSLGISDSGWMTTEAFYEYMTTIFYPYLIGREIEFPVLVYLDGHASHVSLPLVTFCREKNIEIISLYPHSTHITQPLDIAFFHPLKDVYNKKAILRWKIENKTDKILKENFTSVLTLAVDLFENEQSAVVSGFKRAGLYPFNPDAVEYDVLKKSKSSKRMNKTEECDSPNLAIAQQSQSSTEESGIGSRKSFLAEFEEKLSRELLELFQASEKNQIWAGPVKYEGLFEYWLKLKQSTSSGANSDVSTIIDNSVNEKIEHVNDSLAFLEPSGENEDDKEIQFEFVEKTAHLDERPINNQCSLTNDKTISDKILCFNEEHENNISILSDMLSENIHISPVKESNIDEQTSSPNITTENILYASECSASEISNLLGENNDVMNQWQTISVPVISQDSCVDSELIMSTKRTIQETANIENKSPNVLGESFNNAFVRTLPTTFLPKKKRIKLKKCGKQLLELQMSG